jgi:hypothetical protein
MKRPGTKSMSHGRSADRAAAATALLLLCTGSMAMANVRAAADIGVLELYPGAVTYNANEQLRVGGLWLLKAQAVRVELGAEFTDHVGVTAGATLAEVFGIYQFSILPISARVYWGFTPNQLWVRSAVYVSASYYHHNFEPDEPTPPQFVSLGVGATYTFYAVTARAELFAPVVSVGGVGLLLGVQVGGSYILGGHGPSD